MAIVFAVRGTDLNARYAGGSPLAKPLGATKAVVNSAQTGIGGDNTIDMSGGASAIRPLCYQAPGNTPLTGNLSFLMRVYFDAVNINQGLFKLGMGGRITLFGWNIYLTTAAQFRCYYYDDDNTFDAMFSATAAVSSGAWVDIVFSYAAAPIANGQKIYVDAALSSQQATSKTPKATVADVSGLLYSIGYYSDSAPNSRFHLSELVVWDELIDPTSVTLTSGSGSLNGASRTAYVDVAAFDGSAATGGGRVIKSL